MHIRQVEFLTPPLLSCGHGAVLNLLTRGASQVKSIFTWIALPSCIWLLDSSLIPALSSISLLASSLTYSELAFCERLDTVSNAVILLYPSVLIACFCSWFKTLSCLSKRLASTFADLVLYPAWIAHSV